MSDALPSEEDLAAIERRYADREDVSRLVAWCRAMKSSTAFNPRLALEHGAADPSGWTARPVRPPPAPRPGGSPKLVG